MDQQLESIAKGCQVNMEKAVESLKKEFTKIRTGRANPAILDNVRVDYYGAMTPISQLGNIGLADQMITITAWEKKLLPEIEKAILKANIGLTPQNDGNLIRIPIQPLTEERRKEMVKVIAKIAEDHRTSIRNYRRESNQEVKDLEKKKLFSEDELKQATDKVQKITDDFTKQIDSLTKNKEQELLTL